ncbi:MAG: NAD-dependent epimerase/dehydratase family protein [Alphaproteobacteria bacterium]|nr:NAD-dependent epimerase/dehydratase family protein [Alphaproteobacteria bacterium]
MTTVLVTGMQGWIGRFVQARWPARDLVGVGRSPEVPGFSDGRPLPPGLALQPARYAPLDLRNAEAVDALIARERPGLVLHLAGGTHTAPPALLHDLNVTASVALVRSLGRHVPGARLVMGSTGSIYGETLRAPQDETHPCHPVTDYARSKLAAEQAAAQAAEQAGVSFVSARIFNVIGPGTPPSYLPGVLASQIAAILNGAPPRIQVGPLTTSRDYIDVRDVADALRLIAESDVQGVINVGSGEETVIRRILELLMEIARGRGAPEVTIDWLPPRPSNLNRQVAGVARLAELGFEPIHSLRQSLLALLEDCLHGALDAATT